MKNYFICNQHLMKEVVRTMSRIDPRCARVVRARNKPRARADARGVSHLRACGRSRSVPCARARVGRPGPAFHALLVSAQAAAFVFTLPFAFAFAFVLAASQTSAFQKR